MLSNKLKKPCLTWLREKKIVQIAGHSVQVCKTVFLFEIHVNLFKSVGLIPSLSSTFFICYNVHYFIKDFLSFVLHSFL